MISHLTHFLFDWAKEQTVLKINNKDVESELFATVLADIQKYEDKIKNISADFHISFDQCNALITALHKNPWEKEAGIEQLITHLKNFFPGYEVTVEKPQEVEKTSPEELSEEIEAAKNKAVYTRILFKMMSKHWDIPVNFFTAAEVKKTVHLLDQLALVQDNHWILAMTGKERNLEGTGATEFLDAIKAISKPYMNIQRYKGLGEMNPEQLWETAMDGKTRSLLKVTIEDSLEADRWFSTLMGEDVQGRKEYIEDFGKFAKNLDV